MILIGPRSFSCNLFPKTSPIRASEEQAQILQKDEEITSLQKRLDESQNLCLELEEDVLKNLKYEEFLELVKENSDDYSEIQDLVTR